MEFDGSLGGPEASPGEGRKAHINGRGIEGVDGVVEFETEVFVEVQRAGDADQRLSQVGIDPPIAFLVGPRQGVAGQAAADAHVVELVVAGA